MKLDKMKTQASRSVHISQSLVSMGSGLILGIMSGLILGLMIGVGIAIALGIV